MGALSSPELAMRKECDMARGMEIEPQEAWNAVTARDRAYDGRFVTGVLTTGIYCRPSCAARHPKRDNVRFFVDGAAARASGLRPCKRCLPDDVARDEMAVESAIGLLDAAEERVGLEALAQATGYSPSHFQRVFKRVVGVSPAEYQRGLRARRAEAALASEERVTDAIYDAGYSGPARFYEDSGKRLGMTPSAWKRGGEGAVIHWAIAETLLGWMLVATTERGICRLSFDEGEPELRERFPNADLVPANGAMADLIGRAVAAVDDPGRAHNLPLDVRGTAFQEAVWRELTRIPPGETRSYAEIAAAAGNPKAVRAAGSANGANNVAVLIPCHRVIRSNGELGGYAYGLERKRALLDREASA